MKFHGIAPDGNRGRKKFCCTIKAGSKKEKVLLPQQCPINHERFCEGKRYGCTTYIDITDDHRTLVPRESKRYKDNYKLRTEVERYFSRLGPREIEEMSTCKYRSVRNQMTLAYLALSLNAIAATQVFQNLNKSDAEKNSPKRHNL